MMIEPPSEARIGGVLEVHDGIDVAIEKAGLEQLRSLVGQARKFELSVGIKLGFQEPREERRGGRSVEAMVVIEDPRAHLKVIVRENLLVSRKSGA